MQDDTELSYTLISILLSDLWETMLSICKSIREHVKFSQVFAVSLVQTTSINEMHQNTTYHHSWNILE